MYLCIYVCFSFVIFFKADHLLISCLFQIVDICISRISINNSIGCGRGRLLDMILCTMFAFPNMDLQTLTNHFYRMRFYGMKRPTFHPHRGQKTAKQKQADVADVTVVAEVDRHVE